MPTDKKFTGQRLDSTGLYYYNARYYDPVIGRFISPDTIVPNPANPQSLNRYSYCLNNPLRYSDPTGHDGVDPNDPTASYYYWLYQQMGEQAWDTANQMMYGATSFYPNDSGNGSSFAIVAGVFGSFWAVGSGGTIIEFGLSVTSLVGAGTVIGVITIAGGAVALSLWGVEYNAEHFDVVENAILYTGPLGGYLYAKSQDSRLRAVESYLEVIKDHEGKISGSPGSPNRGDWEKHIVKAINNIKKELDKMGPVAKQKAIELLIKSGMIMP
jgi:RHS repeat-associated protein